jgi:hypothetical protein
MTKHETKSQLADLGAKLLAHRAKATEHEAAIAAVSLPAQTGDAAARKRLDKLIAETPSLAAEARSIEYAIASAKERLAAIEAAAADAAERDKAEKALAQFDALLKRGAALDVAFDAAIAELGALEHDFKALELLGYAPTTWNMVKINLELATQTKLQLVKLQQDSLAPRQQRSFVSVISGYADNVTRRARARIERGGDGAPPTVIRVVREMA